MPPLITHGTVSRHEPGPHRSHHELRSSAMSNARDVTAETFDTEVLQSSKPVVVDFWADWCRPYLAFAPILDQLASDHSDKINLVKVDTEAEPQLAAKYGIMALPTLKVFVNGEVVNSLSGLRSKAALETELAGILS